MNFFIIDMFLKTYQFFDKKASNLHFIPYESLSPPLIAYTNATTTIKS